MQKRGVDLAVASLEFFKDYLKSYKCLASNKNARDIALRPYFDYDGYFC